MDRRALALLGVTLAACIIIRLGFVLQVPKGDYFYPDGYDYSRVASGIADGRGFYPPDMKPFILYRAPVYPFFLAGMYHLWGRENFTAVRVVHSAVAAATGLLLFGIGRILGGTVPALVALSLFAIHPFFIYHTATISPETVLIFLTTATYYFLFRLFVQPRWYYACGAGGTLGFAALAKGTILLILPAACLTILFALRQAWRRAWGLATTLAIITFVVISPLSIWSYARWHEFSLILDGSGLNFWIANSDYSYQLFTAKTADEFQRVQRHLWLDVLPALEDEIGTLGPAARDAHFFRMGWQDVKTHPGRSLWMALERFQIFWRPWVHPKAYGIREVLVSAAAGLPLFFFGFWALFRRLRWKCPDAIFSTMAMFFITLVAGMLFNTEIRWRIPLIDSLLIVYAALGLSPFLGRLYSVCRRGRAIQSDVFQTTPP